MGYIKESDGIDFIINGKPLTDEEAKGISEFIKADKAKINYQTPVDQKAEKNIKQINNHEIVDYDVVLDAKFGKEGTVERIEAEEDAFAFYTQEDTDATDQLLKNYAEYLEATSKSEAKQVDIDKLADEINTNWWNRNKEHLLTNN